MSKKIPCRSHTPAGERLAPYQEDLAPLGLSWIRLGLQDVLYDPKTKRIYTPNTGQVSVMGEQTLNPPQEPPVKQKEEPDA